MNYTSLDDIIGMLYEDKNYFYRKVSYCITKKEYMEIKSTIDNKTCINCTNILCNKVGNICSNWDNRILVGKQKVLKVK